ncbi:hypothetical protein ACFYNO_31300 [Kitasatospora sp. NPDC006697]|uniref:hypothetical protein n=1 Tax=Kitasatospora sp. NPDC006697 TaxID=3364020 RepID=UPI0036B6FB0E
MTDQLVAEPRRRPRPRLSLRPLRTRGFRLLLLGQAASEFGNAFQAVSLPLLVYAFGGGTERLSLVVSASPSAA